MFVGEPTERGEERGPVRMREREHRVDEIGAESTISVGKKNPLAASRFRAHSAGIALASPVRRTRCIVDHTDARITFRCREESLARAIGATIEHINRLEVASSLSSKPEHTCFDDAFFVVRWDHDREEPRCRRQLVAITDAWNRTVGMQHAHDHDDRRNTAAEAEEANDASEDDPEGSHRRILLEPGPCKGAATARATFYTAPPMRILLTNDDGFHAPGIEALHGAIRDLGEVVVIAPSDGQSATSHGITFHTPLMVEEVTANAHMKGFAIDGRPADCVKLGLRRLWPDLFGAGQAPDLVISGMNSGANVGINVIYSGTVGAAVEAAFLGVPAIAVSLHMGGGAPHWRRAAEIARHAIDEVLQHRIDAHNVININVPRTHTADAPMPPIRVVSMNTAAGIDNYERRESPSGQAYYWPNGDGMKFYHTKEGTDVEALNDRFLSITPLQYDLTDTHRIAEWRQRLHGR